MKLNKTGKPSMASTLLTLFLASTLFFIGCDTAKTDVDATGTLSLSMADGPSLAGDIKKVVIKIIGIEYHRDGSWETASDFGAPISLNLLDFADGTPLDLGDLELPAGDYTKIRFQLDIDKQNEESDTPTAYIEKADTTIIPLKIPSGGSRGYQANGNFVVPENGEVDITADFDVNKAIVIAGGSGKHILKPIIRLVVTNQAGSITGTVTNTTAHDILAIFAYENDAYTNTEDDNPSGEESRFPNSIVTSPVASNIYGLHFLASGTYDLIVSGYDSEGNFQETLGSVQDVVVTSEQTTSQNINTGTLTAL